MAGIFGWNPFSKKNRIGDQAKRDVRRAYIIASIYQKLRAGGFGGDLKAQNLARQLADDENAWAAAWGRSVKFNLGDVVSRWFFGGNVNVAEDERRTVMATAKVALNYFVEKGQLESFLEDADIRESELW